MSRKMRRAFLISAVFSNNPFAIQDCEVIVDIRELESKVKSRKSPADIKKANRDMVQASYLSRAFISIAHTSREACDNIKHHLTQSNLEIVRIDDLAVAESEIDEDYLPDDSVRAKPRMLSPLEPIVLIFELDSLQQLHEFFKEVFCKKKS